MSLFKPFRRDKKSFVPSRPPGEGLPSAEPEPASGTAPAVNREVTPPPPPSRPPGPTPEQNFAMEAEKQRQAELQAEWTQAVDTLGVASRMMTAASSARRDALHQAAPLIAQVVRTVVERVLVGTLAVDDSALANIVRNAADALPDDAVSVRMPASDLERVRHLLPEALAKVIEADDTVQGGCVAETQRATVDASIEATMQAVDAMLAEWAESLQS